MSSRGRPTLDLMQIAASGGGFVLDAAGRPTVDLQRIAASAASRGAKVIFRGMEARPTLDLQQIAAAGRGVVTFVGTEE